MGVVSMLVASAVACATVAAAGSWLFAFEWAAFHCTVWGVALVTFVIYSWAPPWFVRKLFWVLAPLQLFAMSFTAVFSAATALT